MKIKTKHTPGPWKVHPKASRIVLSKMGQNVSDCSHNVHMSHGEQSANACLIATAPDQNVVLKKIAERLDRWQRNGIQAGPKGRDSDFEELKSEARAAIVKADGGES